MIDGFFINPILALRWKNPKSHIDRIADLGGKNLIIQWTSGHGRSFYPSQTYGQDWDANWLTTCLEAAEDYQIDVWLGLDSCYTTTEWHYDKMMQSYLQRCQITATELSVLYQDVTSFCGFYIPIQLDQPVKKIGVGFLREVAQFCHELGYSVSCSATIPCPHLIGLHYEANTNDREWIGRVKRLRNLWRRSWQHAVDESQLDLLIINDSLGLSTKSDLEDDLFYLQRTKKWVSHSLHAKNKEFPQLPADAQIGFTYHDLSVISRSTAGVPIRKNADQLGRKADTVGQFLQQRCLIDGQVVSVLDTRFPIKSAQNQWQEDADWMTGLYVGAESLRYAVTGKPEAADFARQSWEALHKLSNISGKPGVVARYYLPEVEGKLGEGRKRWHRNNNGVYWIGDISRDQLSGHIFGLATYFDHVATDVEKEIIRTDVEAITDLIIENQMMAVDLDGQPCIHGNFWVSPLFALSFLKSAYHITQKDSYQDKYLELVNPHYFLGHALQAARISSNPFFQHYHQDSPLYHLLIYEDDTELRQQIRRICHYLYSDTHRHGNAYLMIDQSIAHPESDSGQKAVAELYKFQIENLNVLRWDQQARVSLKDRDLPHPIRTSLAYILAERNHLPNGQGSYLPIEHRPPKEFGWNYYVGEEARRAPGHPGYHGIHVQYSGVDYLLAYWMARYHSLVG